MSRKIFQRKEYSIYRCEGGQGDSNGYKTAKAVNSLGMNAVQMVKYVYRKAETKDDDSTKANIEQVKESLKQLQ